MKIQIRKGVFETNSSSEHSISIVKKSNFDQWKNGTLYAKRSSKVTEYHKTWGNFWSEQYYWSFDMITKEEADRKNIEILKKNIKKDIDEIDKYESTHNDPAVNRWAEDERAKKNAVNYDSIRSVDKLYGGMWMTYNEYQDALHQDDCYSPFEHVNETEDVVVFGKYFHS